MQKKFFKPKRDTSWQKVSGWYNRITEEGKGHFYHQSIVIPQSLKLLNLSQESKLLDLACGNGVMAKSLPNDVEYLGVDLSENLINSAKFADKNTLHRYLSGDITKPLTIPVNFTHAVIILALQNLQNPGAAIANASRHMATGGKLLVVINHPMFRIPRQSSWGVDPVKKTQYRRIDRYLSPMTIPIKMNMKDPKSPTTLSYHLPLSQYSKMLNASGFAIKLIEEWASPKQSQEGRTAKMENRSRIEIPLFMAILAVRNK
jgi:ubiquinone/menaquinone biosynthesis C-methylase UbiE